MPISSADPESRLLENWNFSSPPWWRRLKALTWWWGWKVAIILDNSWLGRNFTPPPPIPRDLKELSGPISSCFLSVPFTYCTPLRNCLCLWKCPRNAWMGFFYLPPPNLLFHLENIKHIWQRRAILLFNHLSSKWQAQYNSLAQKNKFKLPR